MHSEVSKSCTQEVGSHTTNMFRSFSASAVTSSSQSSSSKNRIEPPSTGKGSKSDSKLQPLLNAGKGWPSAKQVARLSVHSNSSAMSADTTTSLNTEYRGPIIPPSTDKNYRRRTIILCFDGTGDQFDMDNSNVIQFFSVLKKGDRKRQLVYYQSGIGTYTIPQVATPLWSRVQKTLDLMFASNLDHHVMSGYHFLMQNYKEGDKVCLFGFSRGAYTARALAGMIHKVGLLPAGNEQQVPFAYKMYSNDSQRGWKQSVAFKRTFSMDIDIDFVGVWDTVASVGLLPRTLPFTKSNTAIKVFRHALSLDEHRVKFKPSIYEKITAEEASRGDYKPPGNRPLPSIIRGRKQRRQVDSNAPEENKAFKKQERSGSSEERTKRISRELSIDTTFSRTRRITRQETSGSHRSSSGSRSRVLVETIKQKAKDVSDSFQEVVERVSLDRSRSRGEDDSENIVDLSPDSERDRLEQMYLDRSKPTDILEVWFSGCHCDVGGGSVSNDTRHSLARIPLRWMIRECFLARTGIQFEAEKLRELGLDPSTLYPKVITPSHPVSIPSTVSDPKPEAEEKHRVLKKAKTRKGDFSPRDSAVSSHTSHKEDVKTTDAGTSVEVIESDAPAPGHRRRNNFSLSTTQTLVDPGRDSDEESIEAPHVIVQKASFIRGEKSPAGAEDYLTSPATPGSMLSATARPRNKSIHLDASPTSPTSPNSKGPRTPLEIHNDLHDLKSQVFDQLNLAKWWWILEYIPLRERIQRSDGTWKKEWMIGRGKPRKINREEPIMVHKSVKLRMESQDLKYQPRMKFDMDRVIWVD